MRWTGVLIERTGELEVLEQARQRVTTGRGQVVLIEGPAGIGKSRLVEAVRDWAPAVDVLGAQGGLLEREIPFGLSRQLFERRLLRAEPSERSALLVGPAERAEHVLGVTDDDLVTGGPRPSADLGSSLHSLFWLVVHLADRGPVVFAVDDVHWADLASLHYLLYVARRIEDLPIGLVVAAREGEPGPHEVALAELRARATNLRPAPLSEAGVREFVGNAIGDQPPEVAQACRAVTGGNPFLLVELMDAIAPSGGHAGPVQAEAVRAAAPSSVARSVLFRIGRLPEPAPRLAITAALLADGSPLRHAAALAGIAPSEAELAADALVRVSVLTGVHPLRFAHPLVRAAIVNHVPPAERAALHRAAALILNQDGEPNDRIVPHLLEAAPGGDAWVVDALRRAARSAMARGAPDVAVRMLQRALEEPPQSGHAQLLAELAQAQFTSGALEECLPTFERALERATDPEERTAIRLTEGIALLSTAGPDAAVRCLEQGLAEVANVDAQLTMRFEAELAMQYTLLGQVHPVFERLERQRDVPGDTGPERFVLALLAQQALRRDEPCEMARQLALRALAAGRLLEDESGHSYSYYLAASALIDAEAYEEARSCLDTGLASSALRSFRMGYVAASWLRGVLALRQGDLPEAEAYERAAADNAIPMLAGHVGAALALVLLEKGDLAAARAELERVGLFGTPQPMLFWGPYVRGLLFLAEGRAAAALADFEQVGRHATGVGGFACGLPWQAEAALALAALGDQSAARHAAAQQLDRAVRRGGSRLLGIALRVCGLVETGDERLRRLVDAVEVLEGSPAKLELARARRDLGVTLLRAGRRSDGRAALERSLAGARQCGAQGLAQAVHAELRVAGARPRRLTFTGVESLTASERRVAQMAAARLSNYEIAQALFVTPKTVENHLSRVYAKLGVSSRKQLSTSLAGLRDGTTAAS